MKKNLIVFVSIFVLATMALVRVSNAQNGNSVGVKEDGVMPTSPNAVYVELLGNGLIYSINYDRLLSPNTGIRVGFGYIGITGDATTNPDGTTSTLSASLLTIPATFNFFVCSHDEKGRLGSSKLELGAGIIFVHAGASFGSIGAAGSGVGGTATIGYRLQPYDGGFLFRIGFTPIFVLSTFIPYGGLSAGLSF